MAELGRRLRSMLHRWRIESTDVPPEPELREVLVRPDLEGIKLDNSVNEYFPGTEPADDDWR